MELSVMQTYKRDMNYEDQQVQTDEYSQVRTNEYVKTDISDQDSQRQTVQFYFLFNLVFYVSGETIKVCRPTFIILCPIYNSSYIAINILISLIFHITCIKASRGSTSSCSSAFPSVFVSSSSSLSSSRFHFLADGSCKFATQITVIRISKHCHYFY